MTPDEMRADMPPRPVGILPPTLKDRSAFLMYGANAMGIASNLYLAHSNASGGASDWLLAINVTGATLSLVASARMFKLIRAELRDWRTYKRKWHELDAFITAVNERRKG